MRKTTPETIPEHQYIICVHNFVDSIVQIMQRICTIPVNLCQNQLRTTTAAAYYWFLRLTVGDWSKSSWEEPLTYNHVSNTTVLLADHKSRMQLIMTGHHKPFWQKYGLKEFTVQWKLIFNSFLKFYFLSHKINTKI